jgi:hypothetical protein
MDANESPIEEGAAVFERFPQRSGSLPRPL